MEKNIEFGTYVVASDQATSMNLALLPLGNGIVSIPLIQEWNDQLCEDVQETIQLKLSIFKMCKKR